MKVIVIGAGMGGMAAAIQLAARGAQVTLLEKNTSLGGKLNRWEQDGYRFDTGPHVLTMPWAIEEVFAAAGTHLTDHVSLVPLPVICRYHFPGSATEQQRVWDAPADMEKAAAALEAFAPGEEAGFRRFLAYARQVSEATTDPFLRQDFGAQVRGIPSRAQWGQLAAFLRLRPWQTLRSKVRECFQDPHLRQIFELYALYSGSHPARCSSIFATVADVQWRQGTYYVVGGLYRLAEAMQRVLEGLDVDIRRGQAAAEIIVEAGRARGVRMADGTSYTADAVICNADCLTAVQTLVPAASRRRWNAARVAKIAPSTSAYLLLLGVEGEFPCLAHHNAFLPEDLDREFVEIFDQGVPASDPTIGVACQSITDPTAAPQGCTNLFVMTNPPALSSRFDWRTEAPQYREKVLTKLERMGLTGLRTRIRVEQMWTPLDLEARYGAWCGAIYGLSSNGPRNAFLRPPQVSPDVRNLYFVGGSTHPGGGLPLCALSGTNAARRVWDDLG